MFLRNKLLHITLALVAVDMLLATTYVVASPLYYQHFRASLSLLCGCAVIGVVLGHLTVRKEVHDFLRAMMHTALLLMLFGVPSSFLVAVLVPGSWRQLFWTIPPAMAILYLIPAFALEISWMLMHYKYSQWLNERGNSKPKNGVCSLSGE